MNTVLDDNKKVSTLSCSFSLLSCTTINCYCLVLMSVFLNFQLCLMSGEIIQLSNVMSLIFECRDLSQASVSIYSK